LVCSIGRSVKLYFSSCFWLDPKANKNQGAIKGDFCRSKTAVAFYRCMLRSAVGDSKYRHRRYFGSYHGLSHLYYLPATRERNSAQRAAITGDGSGLFFCTKKLENQHLRKEGQEKTALRAGKPYDGFAIMQRALNGETPSVPRIGSLGAAYAISHSLNDVETLHATSLLHPCGLSQEL